MKQKLRVIIAITFFLLVVYSCAGHWDSDGNARDAYGELKMAALLAITLAVTQIKPRKVLPLLLIIAMLGCSPYNPHRYNSEIDYTHRITVYDEIGVIIFQTNNTHYYFDEGCLVVRGSLLHYKFCSHNGYSWFIE